MLSAGGTLSAIGAYTFVYVMWRTLDGTNALRRAKQEREAARTKPAIALPIA